MNQYSELNQAVLALSAPFIILKQCQCKYGLNLRLLCGRTRELINEILLPKFKKGLKGKIKVLELHQTVERPRKGTQVGGQLFGVRLTIFNFRF